MCEAECEESAHSALLLVDGDGEDDDLADGCWHMVHRDDGQDESECG